MKIMKKTALLAAMMCTLTFGAVSLPVQPVQAASASGIGTLFQSAAAYKQIDDQIDYYNKTDKGRQDLYDQMVKAKGSTYDAKWSPVLDSVMSRLSSSIAKTDSSITKKPYKYFLNNDETFNAACSFGHVMTVNKGLFSLLTNEDEIAVVLGHEMGHGQKDHVANSLRKQMRVEIAKELIAERIGGSALKSAVLNTIVNRIDTVHITRADEWEADNLSYDYITGAGYNPGATAATWQRVMEKYGDNKQSFVGEIFSPSDHPTNQQRRDNYANKLTKYSNNHVTVKNGTVYVNGKEFVKPAATGSMSSAERSYFVMGNLVAAYHNGHNKNQASVSGNTVYLGAQNIMTSVNGDKSASELAKKLNSIK